MAAMTKDVTLVDSPALGRNADKSAGRFAWTDADLEGAYKTMTRDECIQVNGPGYGCWVTDASHFQRGVGAVIKFGRQAGADAPTLVVQYLGLTGPVEQPLAELWIIPARMTARLIAAGALPLTVLPNVAPYLLYPQRPSDRRLAVGRHDVEAYANYRAFCESVSVKPLSLPHWMAFTGLDVRIGHEAEVNRQRSENHEDMNPKDRIHLDGRDHGWARPRRAYRPNLDVLLSSSAHDAMRGGMTLGKLREDGSVMPDDDTSQADTFNPRGAVLKKTCKRCRLLLPIDAFAKQGDSHRSVCKVCDHARRRPRPSPKAALVGGG